MDLKIIITLALVFYVLFVSNDFLFHNFHVDQYTSLVFLPSGARVLFSMVFESNGAIGLALGSLLVSFFYIHEPSTAVIIGNAVASGVGAFAARELCVCILDLEVYLHQITLKQIMYASIIYSMINTLLRQSIFNLLEKNFDFFLRSWQMLIGDLLGALIFLMLFRLFMQAYFYIMKKRR
jgi:hypothetical protein